MVSEDEYIPDESEMLGDVAENAVFNLNMLEEQAEEAERETDENALKEIKIKKKRGRPTKISEEISESLEASSLSTTQKKRGRPKGGKNKKIDIEVNLDEFLDDIDDAPSAKKKKSSINDAKKINQVGSKTEKEIENIETYLAEVNRLSEENKELTFSDKESIKDQLTFLTKGQLKFEKIVGTANKEELIKYAKCLDWFKSPLPPVDDEIKFISTIENAAVDINKIKVLGQNTQKIQIVSLALNNLSNGSKKQRLVFDNISEIFELDTNQSIKMPEQLCNTPRTGYILNHGVNTQITDCKWFNFKDRHFYIVSKLLSRSYLDNAYSKKLSIFYNPDNQNETEEEEEEEELTENFEETYLLEIWEFKKNVGFIMLKDYTHNFGVLTQIDILPGSVKEKNNFIEFLLVVNSQSQTVKVISLNTFLQDDESMVELITKPLVNIEYLNDMIVSHCVINSTEIFVGTYSGRVALFDLNVSNSIPVVSARLGDSMIDQLCLISDTTVIGASLYDGQIILLDYKNISATVTTIAKNRWISPALIGTTDFTKGLMHTDGQRALFNSPLNCLDAKTCAIDITTIISCFSGTKQHPYTLVGTSNGELSVVNNFIKTLVSKRNQSDCVYTKIFSWNYDTEKKVYQLDGTYEVEKTIKPRGAHEIGFGYKGCVIKKCEWIDSSNGERYFSFINAAGITVVTKLD
ncbi:hypothetical protein QEN19_002387 [Hanseniaspora menglaensis]